MHLFLFFKGQHISPSCSSFHRLPVSWLHSPRRLLRCRSAQRLCKGRCSFSLRQKNRWGGPNFKGEQPIHSTVCRECSFFLAGCLYCRRKWEMRGTKRSVFRFFKTDFSQMMLEISHEERRRVLLHPPLPFQPCRNKRLFLWHPS